MFRFLFLFFMIQISFAESLSISKLKLPPGFQIEIYAYPVSNARSLAKGDHDTIFVGTLTDKVYAIVKDPKAQYGTRVLTLLSHLNIPNGVTFYNHDLYIAEMDRILRLPNVEEHLNKPNQPLVIYAKLPKDREHGWRYIAFGPDKKLYIAIGMPCNICLKKDSIYGSIARMNSDGTQFEIYATGIRNSVGFDWHPQTKNLWFTDNGRDWLGDEVPPDELNEATTANLNFGFPYYNGNLPDPTYSKYAKATNYIFPIAELPAHIAALGMKFYTGKMFPKEYHQQIFIAEHGSWNRSKKIGYAISVVDPKTGTIKPFVTGWLQAEQAWGRPVDLLQLDDGSLLISDDKANAIYRVTKR